MNKKGIDVSGWQGKIEWKKVKNSGVEFAIIKLGNIYENDENDLDSQFERNYQECKKNNIPVGVYVYSYAKTKEAGIRGAKHVLNNLKGKELELPVYIDLEDINLTKISKKQLSETVIAFGEEIEKAGLWAGIYCNLNWAENVLDMEKLSRFTLWIAQYYNECQYKGRYAIWQNSSTGQINGISGNVDTNIMCEDIIQKHSIIVPKTTIFKIGNTYITQVDLNVRTGAGEKYRIKKYIELTEDGKKHAYKQENAVLKKRTKVTCLDINVDEKDNLWLKIPSGFICANYEGSEYIK